MQEDTIRRAVLPNRKERRRQAALIKRPPRPTCACCQPVPQRDDVAELPDDKRSLSVPSLA
jgi:hypothetical protein